MHAEILDMNKDNRQYPENMQQLGYAQFCNSVFYEPSPKEYADTSTNVNVYILQLQLNIKSKHTKPMCETFNQNTQT